MYGDKLKAAPDYAEVSSTAFAKGSRTNQAQTGGTSTSATRTVRPVGGPGDSRDKGGTKQGRLAAIFVRHGETAGNAAGLVRGQKDYPLNAAGRTQAARDGQTIARHGGVSTVFHSRLSRGRDTASAIATASDAKTTETTGLLPWDKGNAQGKPERDENPKLRVFAEAKPQTAPPGGEPFSAFSKRVDDGARSIVSAGKRAVASGKKPVAAVSHSVDMRRLGHAIEGKAEPDALEGGPKPGEMMGVTTGNKVVKVKPGMWGTTK